MPNIHVSDDVSMVEVEKDTSSAKIMDLLVVQLLELMASSGLDWNLLQLSGSAAALLFVRRLHIFMSFGST